MTGSLAECNHAWMSVHVSCTEYMTGLPVIEGAISYVFKDRTCGWAFGNVAILDTAGNVMSHAHDIALHSCCNVVSLAGDAFVEDRHEGICSVLHIYIAADRQTVAMDRQGVTCGEGPSSEHDSLALQKQMSKAHVRKIAKDLSFARFKGHTGNCVLTSR